MDEEDKVRIGCRLPAGYVLRWQGDKVVLRGSDGVERSGNHGFQTVADAGIGIISPLGYGETEVSRNFWLHWLMENDSRNEVKSGHIFEIR